MPFQLLKIAANAVFKDPSNRNKGAQPMPTPNFKFNLGDLVKDRITGFQGIVYSRNEWFNTCNTYGVKPLDLRDGTPQENVYFDEPQLVLVEPSYIKPPHMESAQEAPAPAKTGGPIPPVATPNR